MNGDCFRDWVDIVAELLQRPLTELPHDLIMPELARTFDSSVVTWHCRSPAAGTLATRYTPSPVRVDASTLEWMGAHLDDHPLVRWFSATNAEPAQTIGRLPADLSTSSWGGWREALEPLSVTAQLSMPLGLEPRGHRAYVLSRNEEYTDTQVSTARRLQHLLRGIERQAATLKRWYPPGDMSKDPAGAVSDSRLTPRELAVLGLLAEGLTAAAIGRRLSIAPRTVTKHLEHVYTKLGVSDRLAAVMQAYARGILLERGEAAGKLRYDGAGVGDRVERDA